MKEYNLHAQILDIETELDNLRDQLEEIEDRIEVKKSIHASLVNLERKIDLEEEDRGERDYRMKIALTTSPIGDSHWSTDNNENKNSNGWVVRYPSKKLYYAHVPDLYLASLELGGAKWTSEKDHAKVYTNMVAAEVHKGWLDPHRDFAHDEGVIEPA